MTRLTFLSIVLVLASACGTAPPAAPAGVQIVEAGPTSTLGPAGQAIFVEATDNALEATRVMIAAQQAEATAAAQETQAAFEGFNMMATQQALGLTMTAEHDMALEAAAEKTQEAKADEEARVAGVTATHVAAEAELRQAERQAEESAATGRTVRVVVTLLAIGALVVAGSFAISKYRWDSQDLRLDKEERRKQAEIDALQKIALMLASAVKQTRQGLVFVDPYTRRVVPIAMLPAGPSAILRGEPGVMPDRDEVGEAGRIIMNDGEDSYAVKEFTVEELEAHAKMAAFLDAAIAYWDGSGRDGAACFQVPSVHRYAKRNTSPWKSGELWQEHRDLFGDALISTAKGTYCPTDYPTLGELREAVVRGRIPICWPQPAAAEPAEQGVP